MADPGQDDRESRDRDLDAVAPGQAAEPTSPDRGVLRSYI
jgi:hypothetical protein